MMNKLKILANILVDYSIAVKENEKVLISVDNGVDKNLIRYIMKNIIDKGGYPYLKINDEEINNLIYENLNDLMIDSIVKRKQFEVNNYDAFISICYNTNDFENKNTNISKLKELGNLTKEIDDIRINKRKWVLLNYPSALDAYKSKMTTSEFYDFAIDTMIFDYSSMNEALKPLKELMEKTDKVHIKTDTTDLTFSIKGMPAIICAGKYNIPDGEIYTAPIKDSVNGYITYNTPSPYRNSVFTKVKLTFKDGKIIKCESEQDNDKLEEIFNTDEGSRYVGEFAIGVNPLIRNPMGDILYDEKITGSLHFTPGNAYADAFNGNISSIHWDLVLIQRKEYGGGEIYFDDVLIRKDGKFVLPELDKLNFKNYS